MIGFVRGIVRKYMRDGEFRKAAVYAVIDFVIVVLGILLALQLNNCNESGKNYEAARGYYQTLQSQLNEDLVELKEQAALNRALATQFRFGASVIGAGDRTQTDTLAQIALEMMNYSDFRRRSSIYQTLISSGEIKLISNQQILQNLQHIEELYEYINRLEETNNTVIVSHVVPELKEHIRINPTVAEHPDYLFSYQFKNGLELLLGLLQEKGETYNQAIEEINRCHWLIAGELDR